MTAKEKAKELYDKFYQNSYVPWNGGDNEATTEDCAKDSAIIAVDELIEEHFGFERKYYWEEVKKELQSL